MLPISAVEMANAAGVKPDRFRKALRRERREHSDSFSWHDHNERWIFETQPDYDLAKRILDQISN